MNSTQERHDGFREIFSGMTIRALKFRTDTKSLAALLGLLIACTGLVLYVSDSQVRIKRYEQELSSLRSAWKDSSNRIKERIKREISSSISSGYQDSQHDVSKRDSESQSSESYGVTYTRWGRRDCHGNGRMVYRGHAAGTYYTHTGGGAKYICLHSGVSYTPGKYVEGGQGASHIYGVEYRDGTVYSPLFDLTDTENMALQFHSVPCAVCMAEMKVNQIMIPGRDTCPEHWHKEYSGYIMAGGHSDKHPTAFICVDERPQVVPGTHGDQKGAFLFMVETQCASLLCEPFVAGRELRCVVCTI